MEGCLVRSFNLNIRRNKNQFMYIRLLDFQWNVKSKNWERKKNKEATKSNRFCIELQCRNALTYTALRQTSFHLCSFCMVHLFFSSFIARNKSVFIFEAARRDYTHVACCPLMLLCWHLFTLYKLNYFNFWHIPSIFNCVLYICVCLCHILPFCFD